jgi:hypothetical protein
MSRSSSSAPNSAANAISSSGFGRKRSCSPGHPNIAAIYGLHRHGEDLFMAMEYVPGAPLEVLIIREGRLGPERAASFASAVLSALDYAHRSGVIHRDVKSANIIVTPEGDVKVMDFGIARVLGAQRQTRMGHVVGTLSYMSPEQIQGLDVDARSDLYSVGVVLYEMLSGQLPFQGDTDWKLMQAQISQPPAALGPVTNVSAELESVVMRSLEKSPSARFQSATEFRRVLQSMVPASPLPSATREQLAPFDQKDVGTSLSTPVPTSGANADTMLYVAAASLAASAGVASDNTAADVACTAPSALRSGPSHHPFSETLAASGPPPSTPRRAVASVRGTGSIWWLWLGAGGTAVALFAVWGALWISGRAGFGGAAAGTLAAPPAAPVMNVEARALPPIDEPTADEIARLQKQPASLTTEGTTGRPAPSTERGSATGDGLGGGVSHTGAVAAPGEDAGASGSALAATPAALLRFGKVKVARQDGRQTRESDAILQLEPERLVILGTDGQTVLRSANYAAITDASYARSSGTGVFIFGRGIRHYFSVKTAGDTILIRLDKSNQERILSEFQRLTGRKVNAESTTR